MGSLLTYFRAPFPSRHGFSPSRMPGPSAHVPAIFYSAALGCLLCWPHLILRPFMLIWFAAGIYLGRDFAILCHYMLPLPLVAGPSVAFGRQSPSHCTVWGDSCDHSGCTVSRNWAAANCCCVFIYAQRTGNIDGVRVTSLRQSEDETAGAHSQIPCPWKLENSSPTRSTSAISAG
jgi:hypothetical protein